jgi:hypothetical protein
MTIDSHAGTQERGAKRAAESGRWSGYDSAPDQGFGTDCEGHKLVGALVDDEQEPGLRGVGYFNARGVAARVAALLNGSGRDGLINSDGWDLLVEAAARFRRYEGHHRQRAAEFAEKGRCASGRLAGEWFDQAQSAMDKADANGDLGARIEGWLVVNDPEMQRLGEIWRDQPVHPVDALKAIGIQMDPAVEEMVRTHCDELVSVAVARVPDDDGPLMPERFVVPGSLTINGRPIEEFAGVVAVLRRPPAEGLECPTAPGHRPGCECAVCWPVVHATGVQLGDLK